MAVGENEVRGFDVRPAACCREKTECRLRSLAGSDYRYQEWDWFRRPMRTGVGAWGDPYLDPAVQQLMVTYSAPIHRGGRAIGVATVDITLDQLSQQLQLLQPALGTVAYLTNGDGRIVAASGTAVPRGRNPAMARLLGLIRNPGVSRAEMVDPLGGKPSWVVEQPIASLATGEHWSLILSTPTEALLRPLDQLRNRIVWGLIGLVILVMAAVHFLVAMLAEPLQNLTRQAGRYSAGNFEEVIAEEQGVREIRELSRAFNAMGHDIVRRMEEIRITTEQRERYRLELTIAAGFQQAILPRAVPPFPELASRLDLHALMRPAKEVGGDFFDYFKLANGHLGLVVGDVSDKGAPAALFMTQARLLVRLLARQGLEPAEVLRRANLVLAEDIPGSMFVTLVYVDYDPGDGTAMIVSAGHPAPMLVAPGAEPCAIAHPRALPLGCFPSTRYLPITCRIPEQALLLLYSDGLSEAMNAAGELFGSARILAALGGAREASCAHLAEHLLQQIKTFAEEVPASDDLTFLLLRRLPGPAQPANAPEHRVRLELPADTGILARVAELVTSLATDAGLEPRAVAQFALAVDEAITNVIHHAYGADPSRRFQLDIEHTSLGVRAVVTDTGLPFPFEAARARYDGHADPEQAAGGIGLFLMGRMLDECSYEPGTLDGNRLVLAKHRRSTDA